MRFHRNSITPATGLSIDEDVSFKSFDFNDHYPLLGLENVHVNGEINLNEDNVIVASIKIKGTMILSDSIDSHTFKQDFLIERDVDLLKSYDEDGDGYIFEGNYIDTDELVFLVIRSNVPLSPSSGVSSPKSKEEEEEINVNSPFAGLADLIKDK